MARPWRSETRLTQSKTLSRRHLLVAATIGLTPITLALWFTYPNNQTAGRNGPPQVSERHDKAGATVKSAPRR